MSPTKKFWKGRPVVYRAYDKTGRLIYVGATASDFRACWQWQEETWHRGYLPQSMRELLRVAA